MKLRRILTVLGAAFASLVLFAGVASAHTSVLLDASDRYPSRAPLIVDGTDDFNVYGVLPYAGAVRSYQMNLAAGDMLNLVLFIPDQTPENTLPVAKLPRICLIAPDGTTTELTPNIRETFVEPGPRALTYWRLRKHQVPAAQTGTYSVVVTGGAPARFTITSGLDDEFHGLERGTPATNAQVLAWYDTAP